MRLKVSNVCQLLDKSKYPATQTINGITWTNNGDGTITANGTATNRSVLMLKRGLRVTAGKYCILGKVGTVAFGIDIYADGKYVTSPFSNDIYTIDKGSVLNVYSVVENGVSANSVTIKPQLFDLTEMYGAGNEPTTVEQFRQDFPNEMYDYSPVCWKKFRRLKYVTETKNLFDYNKFNPIWINSGVINSNGYLSKPVTSFNTSLFYPVVGWSGVLPNVLNLLQLKGTYTFSISSISIGDIYIMKYNADGTMNKQLGSLTNNKKIETLTFDESTYVDIKIQKETAVIVTGLMVQEGSTPTPYQPYGYLPLNRGKYIANKEPVQLLDKSKYPATQTNKGVTFTNNGDGTITANGTSTKNYASYSTTKIPRPPIGHKILVLPKNNNSTQDHIYVFGSNDKGVWVDDLGYGGNIITITGIGTTLKNPYTRIGINLNVNKDWVMNNHIYKPQLFDLTAMYGAGNEPTTVAQFRADYPNELYDYNPYNAITFR